MQPVAECRTGDGNLAPKCRFPLCVLSGCISLPFLPSTAGPAHFTSVDPACPVCLEDVTMASTACLHLDQSLLQLLVWLASSILVATDSQNVAPPLSFSPPNSCGLTSCLFGFVCR